MHRLISTKRRKLAVIIIGIVAVASASVALGYFLGLGSGSASTSQQIATQSDVPVNVSAAPESEIRPGESSVIDVQIDNPDSNPVHIQSIDLDVTGASAGCVAADFVPHGSTPDDVIPAGAGNSYAVTLDYLDNGDQTACASGNVGLLVSVSGN